MAGNSYLQIELTQASNATVVAGLEPFLAVDRSGERFVAFFLD